MGNCNSSNQIFPETNQFFPENDLNEIRTVVIANELPDDIKIIFINDLAHRLRQMIERGDRTIFVNRSGSICKDNLCYRIINKMDVVEEVFRLAGSTDSWSRTECETYTIFRKVINSTKPSEIEVLPTHIANQIMRTAIEKEEQCSIMFAPLSEETVVLTSCGHLFSKEGLTTWFQTRSVMEHNCPTCSKHVLKVHSLSV